MLSKILDGSCNIKTAIELTDAQIAEKLDIPWK